MIINLLRVCHITSRIKNCDCEGSRFINHAHIAGDRQEVSERTLHMGEKR